MIVVIIVDSVVHIDIDIFSTVTATSTNTTIYLNMEDNKPEKSKLDDTPEGKPESKPEDISPPTNDNKPRRQSSFLLVKRASVRFDDDDEGYQSLLSLLFSLF